MDAELEKTISEAVREALNKRLPTYTAVGLKPPRFVLPRVAALVTGYTEKAIEQKIATGVWRQNYEWRKAPDGRRLIDLEGYDRWVEGGRSGEE